MPCRDQPGSLSGQGRCDMQLPASCKWRCARPPVQPLLYPHSFSQSPLSWTCTWTCTAQVLALEPKVAGRSDRATVRLAPSGEAVTVRCSELGEKYEADARKR